jgi:isoquinoline 1-oxidoreductase beta subunit
MVIEWGRRSACKLSTDDIAAELEKATLGPGAVAQNIGDADRRWPAPPPRSRRPTRFRSSRTRRMEPMNCTVHVRQDGCEIWVGTRRSRARRRRRRRPRPAVGQGRVHNHLIGGGFGRRLEVDGVIRAVQIAQHVDGP